jgi:hypothetical protein
MKICYSEESHLIGSRVLMTDDVYKTQWLPRREKLSCPAGMRRWNDGEVEFSCSGVAVYQADRDGTSVATL